MESKVKLLGHPVHPMLIVFPLGLLSTAVLFDIITLFTGDLRWSEVAFYMIGAGVIGGVLAAVPGTLDWLAIPRGTRAKRVGMAHGLGNVLVLVLFAVSWLLRRETPDPAPTEAVVAGIIGLGVALVTGWLGGELVDRMGVGVDDGAHVNSPSSLAEVPASRNRIGTAGYQGVERRTGTGAGYAGVERRRAWGH